MGKYFIYGTIAIFLAPVVYSVIMAFAPNVTKSMSALDDKSIKLPADKMYEKCAACHGVNGDGSEGYPTLNTLGKQPLYEKMVAFQNSTGSSTNQAIMKAQLEGMSDDDIKVLAEYISKFKPNPKARELNKEQQKNKLDHQLDTTSVSS